MDKTIEAAIQLANDSYQSGYEEGILEGKRQAYAEVRSILNSHGLNLTLPEVPRSADKRESQT